MTRAQSNYKNDFRIGVSGILIGASYQSNDRPDVLPERSWSGVPAIGMTFDLKIKSNSVLCIQANASQPTVIFSKVISKEKKKICSLD